MSKYTSFHKAAIADALAEFPNYSDCWSSVSLEIEAIRYSRAKNEIAYLEYRLEEAREEFELAKAALKEEIDEEAAREARYGVND